jgi:hypothetical protein
MGVEACAGTLMMGFTGADVGSERYQRDIPNVKSECNKQSKTTKASGTQTFAARTTCTLYHRKKHHPERRM